MTTFIIWVLETLCEKLTMVMIDLHVNNINSDPLHLHQYEMLLGFFVYSDLIRLVGERDEY